MTDVNTFEAKIVRVQAALDEMTDVLAAELRRIVLLVSAGDTVTAVRELESMITSVETFTAEPDPDEEEDEDDDE